MTTDRFCINCGHCSIPAGGTNYAVCLRDVDRDRVDPVTGKRGEFGMTAPYCASERTSHDWTRCGHVGRFFVFRQKAA